MGVIAYPNFKIEVLTNMDNMFILEREYIESKYDVEGVVLEKLIKLYAPRNLDKYKIIGLNEIEEVIKDNKLPLSNIIPVGDLEFISEFMKLALNKNNIKLTPIELPDVLRVYAGRKYEFMLGKELKNSNIDLRNMFVKDADTLKKWNSLLYRGHDIAHLLEDDTNYVVSEYVNILSEYRVFVNRDEILAVQYYLGDVLEYPDGNTIKYYVNEYKKDSNRPLSYTLDIAVADINYDIETIPLEVHNFVACGLYGFYGSDILKMLVNGYRYYLKENI